MINPASAIAIALAMMQPPEIDRGDQTPRKRHPSGKDRSKIKAARKQRRKQRKGKK